MKMYTSIKAMIAFLLILAGPAGARGDALDHWVRRTSASPDLLNDITYANGIYVVVGSSAFRVRGCAMSSSDGIYWSDLAQFDIRLWAVAWGSNRFVAVGENSASVVTSTNGIHWSSNSLGSSASLVDVAYARGSFHAVDSAGCRLFSSPDGIQWTNHFLGSTAAPFALSCASGSFVVLGDRLTTIISQDGITWSAWSMCPARYADGWFNGVTYGKGLMVAVGYGDDDDVGNPGRIFASQDGWSWTECARSDHQLLGVGFGNDTFVAVGYAGVILTSLDGITWTERAPWSTTLHAVNYAQSVFTIVGSSGNIIQSPDTVRAWLAADKRPDADGFEILISGEVGRNYILQGTPTLAGSNWTDLLPFTLSAPVTNLLDRTATNGSQKFYRAVTW